MKVTPRPDVAAKALAEAAARNQGVPRADGIHLSDLLVCLRRSYYDKTIGTPKSAAPRENLRTMLGSAFHAWLQIEPEKQTQSNGRWHNTDRLEVELIYSKDPDRSDSYSKRWVPIEIKSTRYSSAKGLVDYHVDQLAGYCINWGVTKGQMWVLYMYGDYREHRDPQFIVCDVEFTQAELERWERVLNHRQEILEHAIEVKMAPNLDQRLGWACKQCPYKEADICPGGKPGDAAWDSNFVAREDALDFADGG